ncbi:fimbria/pilus outer membrane usher protein [Enterobacter bugandensis]|uniref:fimbria/pilus outer membrane usher protein n=2 Tax=Enterobacter bugandensis TaxID=881260 RepID=UPI001EFA1ED5|nr:fimbria/pilus outer membrane usher protein [Enterobacter bugandensis]
MERMSLRKDTCKVPQEVTKLSLLSITLLIVNLSVISFSATASDEVSSEEYIFDAELFKGTNFDQSVLESLKNPNAIAAGEYKLDVYINNELLGNYTVPYITHDNSVLPCLPKNLISDIGLKENLTVSKNTKSCLITSDISTAIVARTNLSELKLNVSVPQAMLLSRPKDYVNPDKFQTGNNVGFLNYVSNYYHVSYSDSRGSNLDSLWLSLNGGINIASWQYRQISNLNWNKETGYQWNNVRQYVQRPLPAFNTQLMAGQLITNGKFFSGMSYNGLNLSSAEEMLPQSQRGYAPLIKGIASSNAKVTIRQNGQDIYQTTVPPGAFEINDLYPTGGNGDLTVVITEADGTIKTFSVPFSALPESIRPGMSKYNLALGRVRDTDVTTEFGDFIYQRGITNALTANGGLRMAKNYTAYVFGGVHASRIGAIGADATYSTAKLSDDRTSQGWMSHLSWSKTFSATGTNLSLASYRYSTAGYRDLLSVLGDRNRIYTGNEWLNYTSGQRERWDLTLSQTLGDFGTSYINAATQSYRDGRSRDTQYQLGFSKMLGRNISMNVALTRQRVGTYNDRGHVENAAAVSFSIPLFSDSPRPVSFSTSYNHSNSGGVQYQASASGMADDNQTTSYSITAIRDQKYQQNVFSGSLQRRLPKASLAASASKGQGYWQTSANAQGALAVHAGGVTFGPYLGDTFAIVEAKGAEGARIFSSDQTVIDNNGYALIPALTPYRYNNISLDPKGMQGHAEIIDSQKRVVPVAGAAVNVSFKTRTGTALLITVTSREGNILPMGTQVYDQQGEAIGITGQGGQVYVRVPDTSGELLAEWGNGKKCYIPYTLSEDEINAEIVNLSATCSNRQGGVS